ncbi:hypothetical protein TNCV_1471851 [Trichonephila clavipes]|nr:hypothetical protein TNCV_1471851 [Trichonephila clavipes]
MFTPSFLPRGRHLSFDDVKFHLGILILPRAPKPNGHSRDFLHVALSYYMDTVDILHRENPPGSNPQHWVQNTSNKPTTPPPPASSNIRAGNISLQTGWFDGMDVSICVRTNLHAIRKFALMTQMYAKEILRPHVVVNAAAIGKSFLLI